MIDGVNYVICLSSFAVVCFVVFVSHRAILLLTGRRNKRRNRLRRLRHLPVRLFRQTTDYSCTASVLTALVHSITGETLSHEQAIRATRCRPNGASLEAVAKALAKTCGARSKSLKSLKAVRSALRAGRLVISHDALTYRPDDHAIILAGATTKGFYVADSNFSRVRWRREKSLKSPRTNSLPFSRRQPFCDTANGRGSTDKHRKRKK